jgi:hypothetical protein
MIVLPPLIAGQPRYAEYGQVRPSGMFECSHNKVSGFALRASCGADIILDLKQVLQLGN